ncbi:hypothetical protein CNMCM5623_007325 [Aspergillus felis]|uniref:glucose oxidase n=1 Tax=Aspergillus felis TaxID=1287682 RepID=A0A8H6VDF6_9EURO|nr:hypothetical protein CNMCM5623_007325 [Aspergillus felis]KAF7182825.1 hypothetical protein CNMCM7691_002486 [Aspergillus felis]
MKHVPFQVPPHSTAHGTIAPEATGVISNPEKVADQTYDYIIAGGGLTGLTMAAKLLDHPDKFNVLVIENRYYGSEYGPIIDDLNAYEDKDVTEGHHHSYEPGCHNSKPDEGKVEVGARDRKTNWSPLIFALMQTVNETIGAPYQQDLCCGVPHGVSMFLNTLTKGQVRTDAARSWLEGVLKDDSTKARLTVLTGQLVGKVNLEPTEKDDPKYKATGVEFGTHRKNGWRFNVRAKNEVLLAAGSTISPLILQYSGIGPADVLGNPKTTTSVVARTTPEGNGQGQVAYFAAFAEVFGEDAEYYKSLVNHNATLREWAAETVAGGGFHNQSALFLHFEYNPRYFQNKLDLYGQAAASRLARNLTRSGKMGKFCGEETLPGELLPNDASLEDWARYVKQNFRGNYHGVGTCSMMKKELGGVVDENAKVYGVENLRVVDGSIPPTQVSSHVMNVFYVWP